MTASLLIFGGSQAVRRFNAAVAAALPRLVERAVVIHVTGDEGYAPALAGREELPEALRDRYRPHPFLRDDMLAALAAADLVVGRAGSSTLAEVTALGLPMVVVPVPARRRPPAGERAAARRGGRRPADRRCRLRRRGAGRGGGHPRGRRGAPRDVRRGAIAGAAGRRRRGRGSRRWPPRAGRAVAAIRRVHRSSAHAGAGRVTTTTFDAVASGPRSSAASASRRRATNRWRGSRRCASAGRPTCSPPSTTSSSCAPWSASRARADPALRPGPWQRPRHQRPRDPRPGHPGSRRGLARGRRRRTSPTRASRWPGPRPRRRRPG